MQDSRQVNQKVQGKQDLVNAGELSRAEAMPTIIIEPSGSWLSLKLRDLWQYRELLYFLTWRDVKVRYKQTMIGFLWAIIQPLMKMVVFSIIFGSLAKMDSEGFPYPIFLYAALLPWEFFASSVSRSGQSIVASENLIKKVYFPRIIIPISAVGACLLDFAISFTILILMMFYYSIVPTLSIVMIIPLVLAMIFTASGVGLLMSALNVGYRDFRYALPFLVQIWMFLTPVIYSVGIIPEKWRWLALLNPMAGIVDAYRSAILDRPFEWGNLGISMGMAVAIFLCGLLYFRKTEKYFADIV